MQEIHAWKYRSLTGIGVQMATLALVIVFAFGLFMTLVMVFAIPTPMQATLHKIVNRPNHLNDLGWAL